MKPGAVRWFEYHCNESDNSADAELWHRSHQLVTVGALTSEDFGGTFKARCENGTPRVYAIRFSDGFEGEAFEDELLTWRKGYCRSDPPKRRVHEQS